MLEGISNQSVSNQSNVESDHTPVISSKPQLGDTSNEVTSFGEARGIAKHSASGSPADGAREATESQKPSRQDLNRMAEERAMENSDYAEATRLLALCGDLETAFLNMDKETFCANDEAIIFTDIAAILDNPSASADAKVFAQLMRDNPSIWSRLAGGDNKVGVQDVRDFIAGLKSTVKSIKQEALAEVKVEQNIPETRPSAQARQGNGANEANGVPSEAPRPAGSTKPGLDGAMENLDNTAKWLEGEIAKLSGPDATPEMTKKAAELTQKLVLINQTRVQLTMLLQNLAKMWADVSRNAIQNMR